MLGSPIHTAYFVHSPDLIQAEPFDVSPNYLVEWRPISLEHLRRCERIELQIAAKKLVQNKHEPKDTRVSDWSIQNRLPPFFGFRINEKIQWARDFAQLHNTNSAPREQTLSITRPNHQLIGC
ncbi:MAG: hypothetical protein CL912_03770 [Deltaproteobacteria bacterium]|nr:hypothetical protein [Deltaproteobacteria bacterium]